MAGKVTFHSEKLDPKLRTAIGHARRVETDE